MGHRRTLHQVCIRFCDAPCANSAWCSKRSGACDPRPESRGDTSHPQHSDRRRSAHGAQSRRQCRGAAQPSCVRSGRPACSDAVDLAPIQRSGGLYGRCGCGVRHAGKKASERSRTPTFSACKSAWLAVSDVSDTQRTAAESYMTRRSSALLTGHRKLGSKGVGHTAAQRLRCRRRRHHESM